MKRRTPIIWFQELFKPVELFNLKAQQRIRLHEETEFFLGGTDNKQTVWIEKHYILAFFKETEKHYLFNVILNSEKGDVLKNGALVFVGKDEFLTLEYT